MQNQPNETPKIVGLIVAIVVVLAFVIWQVSRVSQPASNTTSASAAGDTANNSMAPAGTETPGITLAGGPGVNRQAGAGQMRLFSDALDSEGGINIGPGRADAFRKFQPPPARPQAVVRPPELNWNPNLQPRGNTFPPPPGGITVRPDTTPPPPPSEPAMDVKLDGVVLGTPREAVLTIVDKTAGEQAGSEKTLYLRAGDKIGGHKILSITEAGLMMQGWREVWMVGQTRTLGGPKKPETAEAPRNGKPSLLPSGLLTVPPPSTLTP